MGDASDLTRRSLLIGAGAATTAAIAGRARAMPGAAAARLFVIRDFVRMTEASRRLFMKAAKTEKGRAVLVVSDAAPSFCDGFGRVLLLRPAAFGGCSPEALAALSRASLPTVVSKGGASGLGLQAARWRELAFLLADPRTPDLALLDLGGASLALSHVEEGMAEFPRERAGTTARAVSIRFLDDAATRSG